MNDVVLKSPRLTHAGFAHGFSLRPWDLALDALDYRTSLERFSSDAGFDPVALRLVHQVHGARAVAFSDGAPSDSALGITDAARLEAADAAVARDGLAVGVRVADCVPILVADAATGRVAAIHAGWKGLVAGVIPAALSTLRRLDSSADADTVQTAARPEPSETLIAAVGPCIGPCCFEVGSDVAEVIVRAVPRSATPIVVRTALIEVPSAGDGPSGAAVRKSYVDLRAAVHAQLVEHGVLAIDDVGGCTRCDHERFFSYRRGGPDQKKRMLAAIGSQSQASRTGAKPLRRN